MMRNHEMNIRLGFLIITTSIFTLLMMYSYSGDIFATTVGQQSSILTIHYEPNFREFPSVSNGFCERQLKVDLFRQNETDTIKEAQNNLIHFPLVFWEENKYKNLYYKNKSCARFPDPYQLKVNNIYWQILRTEKRMFYLFSAYYDVREACTYCPAVRIIGMIDWPRITVIKTYCQVWFPNETEPIIVEATRFTDIMPNYCKKPKNLLYSYLITCPLPGKSEGRVPSFVSLVERECDMATNSLRIIHEKPEDVAQKKDRFAVCVKMLDYLHEDKSVRIIEWIELLRQLGAEKIIFYTLHLHKNITKVLDYYNRRGITEVIPITLAGDQPNAPSFQHVYLYRTYFQRTLNELVSINDCFYRNMYKYNYITPLDIDEVIVPTEDYNWKELINKLSKKASSLFHAEAVAFTAPNTIFTQECDNSTEWRKDIPTYMYMLQHVLHYDSNTRMKEVTKTFFDTNWVVALHNHVVQEAFRKDALSLMYGIVPEEARSHHYREMIHVVSCEKARPKLKNDTTLRKYEKPLVENTLNTLFDLGFV